VLTVDNPSARSYLRSLRRTASSLGFGFREYAVKEGASQDSVLAGLSAINKDGDVDGVLVQTPLPKGIDLNALGASIDPARDVDGLTPYQAGLLFHGVKRALPPSTARAIVEILDFYNYGLQGLEVVIMGRSAVVGRPFGMLALSRNATVTWCHTKTVSIKAVCKRAEVLVVAAGQAGIIDNSYVRPGATVIDVGVNVVGGKLVGDVDLESIARYAAAYTPVPGGVGPVTTACLYANLLDAAVARAGS
jgi:methylenetetrahydrofolate dehydrogenase (NADP+)/methenyltetrahydrofolate cyclohydrolase